MTIIVTFIAYYVITCHALLRLIRAYYFMALWVVASAEVETRRVTRVAQVALKFSQIFHANTLHVAPSQIDVSKAMFDGG